MIECLVGDPKTPNELINRIKGQNTFLKQRKERKKKKGNKKQRINGKIAIFFLSNSFFSFLFCLFFWSKIFCSFFLGFTLAVTAKEILEFVEVIENDLKNQNKIGKSNQRGFNISDL